MDLLAAPSAVCALSEPQVNTLAPDGSFEIYRYFLRFPLKFDFEMGLGGTLTGTTQQHTSPNARLVADDVGLRLR